MNRDGGNAEEASGLSLRVQPASEYRRSLLAQRGRPLCSIKAGYSPMPTSWQTSMSRILEGPTGRSYHILRSNRVAGNPGARLRLSRVSESTGRRQWGRAMDRLHAPAHQVPTIKCPAGERAC